MKATNSDHLRLAALIRIIDKETQYLQATERRLFVVPFDAERAKAMDSDQDLAERVEAFASRFGRLQDTLGDRLLPSLLHFLSEPHRTSIDALNRAEQLGWLPSVERWMTIRKLRNLLVHEYIDDAIRFAQAVSAAQACLPELILVAERLVVEVKARIN